MMKYKKNTYKTWMAALLLGMATLPSCEQESLVTSFEAAAPNTLSLKLFCSESNESRSADDTNNEDAIHRLDIFLYPDGANFNTQAVYQETINNLSSNESHTVSLDLTNGEIEALFGENRTTCRVYAIANRPDGTAWETGETSVDQLKALTITAAFNSFNTVNGISVYQPQADFVMDSDFNIDGSNDIVTLDRNNHTLSGTVPLYRAASKISLVITQVKDVPLTDADGNIVYEKDADGNIVYEKDENDQVINDEDGNPIPVEIMWTANTNGMLVRLHDGVYKTHIDNSVQPYTVQKKTETAVGDYFSFTSGQEVKMTAVGSVWMNTPAFYSYSSNWGKADNPDEEPYLTLIVPWARSDEKNADGNPYYQRTYYQVPISTIAKSLARNTHYKINLVVSRLGSFVEEVPVVLYPSSYIIVPWQSETVNADLMDYRYLMVEEKDVKIYNENEVRIPYASSHEVKLELVRCTHEDLNDGSDKSVTLTEGVHYYLDNGCIVYHRDLINDFSNSNFDFTPYKVELKISHTTPTTTGVIMSETVKITQFPAIYGERDVNTDAENGGGANDYNGFVWVNGYQDNSYKGDTPNRYVISENTDNHYVGYFDNATSGLSGGGDVTSNTMLVFTITSVQGTKYVIGDPREENVNTSFVSATHKVQNNTYSIWEYAPGVEGSDSRLLTNYYATDTYHNSLKNASASNATQTAIYNSDEQAANNERTYNMIAPKFRISSGYGAISSSGDRRYYHLMKKRCASYQEDGYPAGRWRLPTKAEFEFIIYLSYANKIPKLFSTSLNYWCAHGYGQPQTSDGSVRMGYKTDFGSKSVSVRCVYDDWYWGSDPVIDTTKENDHFIWGDQPR